MATQLDLDVLAQEVLALSETEAHRWRIWSVPTLLRVYAEVRPTGREDVYVLRLDFGDAIAAGPPSVVFVERETLREGVVAAWPNGLGEYFKVPPQETVGWICNPWTREGRHHHAEWRSDEWRPQRAIWRVLTAMQDILDKPGYAGRAA